MTRLHGSLYAKSIALYLIAALVAVPTLAGPAEALFVVATPPVDAAGRAQTQEARAGDLARVQAALESDIVRQKLADYGLSPSEILARVNGLSVAQLHELATHTDSLQAGGDVVDAFIGLMIVGALVVVLIFLLQHRIEVR